MKKINSLKRAFLLSLFSTIMCLLVLIGGSYAWFSDTVRSDGNQILAGNLDIEVSYLAKNADGTAKDPNSASNWVDLEGSSSLFSSNKWEPGHTEYVTFKVENKGTLAFDYKFNVTPVSEVGGINVYGEAFKLSDYLYFGTTAPQTDLPIITLRSEVYAIASHAKLNQDQLQQSGSILPGGVAQYITLAIYMPESVGNEANYKTGTTPPSIDLAVQFIANQKAKESDSFDDQYDKDAGDVVTNDYQYVPQIIKEVQIKKEGTVAKEGSTVIDSNLTVKSDVKVNEVNKASSDTSPFAQVIVPQAVIDALPEGDHTIILNVEKDDEANGTFEVSYTSSAPTALDGKETTTYEVNLTKDDVKVTTPTAGVIYPVKLFIGEGKANVQMFHNDVEMTYANTGAVDTFTYDPVTGFVTMYVDKFSPFTAIYDEPICAIGTKVYYSLEDAIANCGSSDVILLLKDIALAKELVINKPIALNLNGHDIEANYSIKVENGALDLQGKGSIAGAPANYKLIYLKGSTDSDAEDYSNLTIGKDVTVESTNGYAVMISANGAYGYGVNVNVNGHVKGYYGALYVNGTITAQEGNVPIFNINEGAVVEAPDPESAAIYASGWAIWNISGGTIYGGDGLVLRSGIANITGGEFTGFGEYQDPYYESGYSVAGCAVIVDNCYPGVLPAISISGGTFKSVHSEAVISGQHNGKTEEVKGFISGGAFSSDPGDLAVVGTKSVHQEDMWYISTYTDAELIEAGYKVRIVGGLGFDNLSDACAAAQTGDTVKVLVDLSVSNFEGFRADELTLDLNSHVVTISTCLEFAQRDLIYVPEDYSSVKYADEGDVGHWIPDFTKSPYNYRPIEISVKNGEFVFSSTSGYIRFEDASKGVFDNVDFTYVESAKTTKAIQVYANNKTQADTINVYSFKDCDVYNVNFIFDGGSGSCNLFDVSFDSCNFDVTTNSNGFTIIDIQDYSHGDLSVKNCSFDLTGNATGGAAYCFNLDTYLQYTNGVKYEATVVDSDFVVAGNAFPYMYRYMTYNSQYVDNAEITVDDLSTFMRNGETVEMGIRETSATNKTPIWVSNAAAFEACWAEWLAYAKSSPACSSYKSSNYYLAECNGYYFVFGQGQQHSATAQIIMEGVTVKTVKPNSWYTFNTIGTSDISLELGASDNAEVHIFTLAN